MPWDPVVESEIVAIHAALTPASPTGEIIYFEGFFTAEAGRSFRYDCASGTVTELTFEPPEPDEVGDKNLFCAGHAQLADGRWLVAGGWAIDAGVVDEHQHGHGGTGIRDCFTYLPRAETWRRVATMHPQPNSELRGGGRWYPTLVTLGNGEVLAVGGHPLAGDEDMADNYPTPNARRHSNNIPERYSPGLNTWTELTAELTAPNGALDEYDRLHLAPSGHVFFSTLAKAHGDTRLYDPYSGNFANQGYGQHRDDIYDDANCASRTASVILPILHTDADNFWILTCGGPEAERLNLLADSPDWLEAGDRETFPGNESPPVREHLLAILLPTGDVFVGCGMRENNTGVMSPEIYSPAINWSTGQYTNGEGSWETLTNQNDQAEVPRGYHSVALLQPDGSVWTAGSTHTGADLTDPDSATRETRIEVFRPSYGGNRPEIDDAPDSVTYGELFPVEMASGAGIDRVVITRCGSFTHAFDGDQRYLTLPFTQNGSTLQLTAPHSSNLAPPGYYLLWALRDANTPCEQARFIRLAWQDYYPVLQLSTYSLLAVKALRPPYTNSSEAIFSEAIELYYDGFLPHELNIPAEVPDIEWEFFGGGAVPGMRIELNRQANQVDPVDHPDTSQKFRFIYDVIFENEDAFDTFDDDETRMVQFRANLNGRILSANLTLMKKANPFMKDGDPPWLSSDLRIHKARVGDVKQLGGPQPYLQALLDSFENANVADESEFHPFDQIEASQKENPVVLAVPQDDDGFYNFAVARVRYLSVPNENADGVKVFFRLFNTVGTALEYDSEKTYRTLDGVAGKIPGLGIQVKPITSIPFFAAPRVTPDAAMTEQQDNVVNRKTLYGQGPELAFRYFGCWLDVNTLEKHFPRYPEDDGPYGEELFPLPLFGEGPLLEMLTHVAGYHQCLVAEISYEDDPTQPRQTPFTSDNLAQRNLATAPVANPGLEEITRTAQTSIDIKPSDAPTEMLLTLTPQQPAGVTIRRFRADELVFSRNNLPPGTVVELFLPDVAIDEVLALSSLRHGPATLERVDDHTLRFELGEVSYVAMPGDRDVNIAGLVSVTLPPGILDGDLYRLTVKQYSGLTLHFVGAFELVIPVGGKGDLLPGEIEKLSILRYIFEAMPEQDRWYPVFERYLYEIAERVRGFGGDPESVQPSPYGTGRREKDEEEKEKGEDECPTECVTGKICDVQYDCFGEFDAFVLVDCCDRRLRLCGSKDLERVVLMAWRERVRVSAHYRVEPRGRRPVNADCPWTGKPVSEDALIEFEGKLVGFSSQALRDKFARAMDAMREAKKATASTRAPNAVCPWSGRPIVRDAVADLPTGSVAFSSRALRDRFLHAVKYFREIIRYLGAGDPPAHHKSRPKTVPSINRKCPWTNKPVSSAALTRFEGHLVGFHKPEDRDDFERAATIAGAKSAHGERHARNEVEEPLNATCPWSGRPVVRSAVVRLRDGAVGFCGSEHRDEFLRAVTHFREAAESDAGSERCAKLVRLVMHC